MKLSKRHLKLLIENYLFEEENPDASNDHEKSEESVEDSLKKILNNFKNIEIPYEQPDIKGNIIKKDGGLCLTIIKMSAGEDAKEEYTLSISDILDSKENEKPVEKHASFIKGASTALAGVKDEEKAKEIHDKIKNIVGDFSDEIFLSRVPAVKFDSWAQDNSGVAKLA